MYKTRVIPSLLLKNHGLVKTRKFTKPVYLGDPVNIVKIFNDKEVDELVVLDITATTENKGPNFDLLYDIASECFMPLGYGGGITSTETMHRLFRIGIEKVCLNAEAVKNLRLIEESARIFGNQSIVVSIDVKKSFLKGKYEIHIQGGRRNTKLNPVAFAKEVEQLGAGEILLNSIDRDGLMQGYDLKLIREVVDAVDIPVIACGGAGNVQHLVDGVREGGASAVSAGSMFVFQGRHRAVLINMPTRQELYEAGLP